jgi:YD repeat-containing protein
VRSLPEAKRKGRGQPADVRDSGTLTTTFEYDGLPALVAQAQVGNRTAQTVNDVTTEYVLDVAGGLPEVIVATTGGASTQYVQVQGQILGQQESGAWVYILPDALGSVRQLVGSDGQVALAQGYDPFGVLMSQFTNLLISQSTDLPISQSPHLLAIRPFAHRRARGGVPTWLCCMITSLLAAPGPALQMAIL